MTHVKVKKYFKLIKNMHTHANAQLHTCKNFPLTTIKLTYALCSNSLLHFETDI